MPSFRRTGTIVALLVAALAVAAIAAGGRAAGLVERAAAALDAALDRDGGEWPPPFDLPSAAPTPVLVGDPVLVGAGDIASCASDGDEATAALLDEVAGVVFTVGDNVYDRGTPREFATCYGPSWGRHRARTRPAPGNHDYLTAGARGYFWFFGALAGDPSRGYYSYDLGAWHVVALNSNCAFIGGCDEGSPQLDWLRADLAAHPAACTLAYWHHPRFSSGPHGSTPALEPIFRALYEAGAELAVSGHDHTYERFAPQDPAGRPDWERGVRQFVVGTGGANHYGFGPPLPNSEVRSSGTWGVLKLTLRPASYDWEFIPVAGQDFRDAGSARCH
jgi:3',5'-cyclic AMP phosphodiesterase CpdA